MSCRLCPGLAAPLARLAQQGAAGRCWLKQALQLGPAGVICKGSQQRRHVLQACVMRLAGMLRVPEQADLPAPGCLSGLQQWARQQQGLGLELRGTAGQAEVAACTQSGRQAGWARRQAALHQSA